MHESCMHKHAKTCMLMQISPWHVNLGSFRCPTMVQLCLREALFPVFWGLPTLISTVAALVYFPTAMNQGIFGGSSQVSMAVPITTCRQLFELWFLIHVAPCGRGGFLRGFLSPRAWRRALSFLFTRGSLNCLGSSPLLHGLLLFWDMS